MAKRHEKQNLSFLELTKYVSASSSRSPIPLSPVFFYDLTSKELYFSRIHLVSILAQP